MVTQKEDVLAHTCEGRVRSVGEVMETTIVEGIAERYEEDGS